MDAFILLASIRVGVYGVIGIMTPRLDVLAVVNRGNVTSGPPPFARRVSSTRNDT